MQRTVISVVSDAIGAGQCTSVVAAVKLVKPGVPATIRISAATYVEESPLTFDTLEKDIDVEFVALGYGLPTLTTQQKSPLRISCHKDAKISFSGIKVESLDELAPAVLILSGRPVFKGCTLQSVHVDGDAEPVIENCTISDSRSNGISICGKAGGRYTENVIRTCPLYGILIDSASASVLIEGVQISVVGEGCLAICGPQSAPTVRNCVFEDIKQTVSKYGDSNESAAKVKTLVVSDMRAYVTASHEVRAAVVVANNSRPQLYGNTIFRAQSHGVLVIAKWTPAKVVNTSTLLQIQNPAPTPKKKGHGAAAAAAASAASAATTMMNTAATPAARGTAAFFQNQIRDNLGYGLYIMDGVSVESNTDCVERNELGGVFVGMGGTLAMKSASVGGRKTAFGVTVSGLGSSCSLVDVEFNETLTGAVAELSAVLDCEGVKFKDSETGILARTRAKSSLKKSAVASCTTGVCIEEYASCRIEATTFEGNDVGVAAMNHGIPEVRDCTLRRNSTAFLVSTSASGFVSGCNISDSSGPAQIDCSTCATTLFEENLIMCSNQLAVLCTDRGRPVFFKNKFVNSRGMYVVSVGAFCDPIFTENRFSVEEPIKTHEGDILIVEEDGVGTFTHNILQNANAGAAVVVCRGAAPTFAFNTMTRCRVGILVESGGEGVFEKNDIANNREANVRVLGDADTLAIPSFCVNNVSASCVGFDCYENSNPLVSRNLIARHTIGVLCRQKSAPMITGNDIARNQCGALASGNGASGTFYGNVIRENTMVGIELGKNTNVTICENSFIGNFCGNEEFDGAPPPEFSVHAKSKPRICAIRADDCYGTIVANRFAFNDIGIEFYSFDNHCLLMANIFTDNMVGVWVRFQKSEYLLGAQPTILKVDDLATVSVCGGVFINNGIGVTAVGNMKVDVDFCVFHKNKHAGATITGRLPEVLLSLCVFSQAGLTNLTVKGDLVNDNAPPPEDRMIQMVVPKRRVEHCLFYGAESNVEVQRNAKDVEIDTSLFVSCLLHVTTGSLPNVMNSQFVGSPSVVAVAAACALNESVSYITDPATVSVLHAAGGGRMRRYLPQVSVTKQLFTLERGILVESNGGGTFSDCIVSFAKVGIAVDGTGSRCVFENCTVLRCLQSGLCVGNWGFAGELNKLTAFCNYAAGVRIMGKCTSPNAFVNCSILGQLAETLLDEPTTQASILSAVKHITFVDNSDDRPFFAMEKFPHIYVDTASPPLYTCPETDGVGVGLLVHPSGHASISDCLFAHNAVSNVIVDTKLKCHFSKCSLHGSEGFGCVIRKDAQSIFVQCHITANYFAGVHSEVESGAEFRQCTFFANTIGATCSSDHTLLDECQFLRNKVCGMRTTRSAMTVVTRCTFTENGGAGLECRGGTPSIAYSSFEANGSCGLLSTSSQACPSVDECSFTRNPVGLVFRARCTGSVKKSFIAENRTGLTSRMASCVQCTNNTFQSNVIGVVVEWEATGLYEKNLFLQQREQSVTCLHEADPVFRANIHMCDSPIYVSQQGKGTFTQCTFRLPTRHCFVVSTAGDPKISYCRFSLVQGSLSDQSRAAKIQERDPAQMRTPIAAPTSKPRSMSKFVTHSGMAGARSFAFPVEEPTVVVADPTPGEASLTKFTPPPSREGGLSHVVSRALSRDGSISREGALTKDGALKEGSTAEDVIMSLNRRLSRSRDVKSQKMMKRASVAMPRRKSSVANIGSPGPSSPADRMTTQLALDVDDDGVEFTFDAIAVRCEQGALGTISNCIFAHNGPASIFCSGAGTSVFIANNFFFDHRSCAVIVTSDACATIRANLFMRNTLGLHLSHCDKRTRVERCTFYQNMTSVDATEGCCGTVVACQFLDDHLSVDCSVKSLTIVTNSDFYKCDYAICGDCCIELEVINSKFVHTVQACFLFESPLPQGLAMEELPKSSAESLLAERRRKPQSGRGIAITDVETFGSQDAVLLSGFNANVKMLRCKMLHTKGSAISLPRMTLTRAASSEILGGTTISECLVDGANCGVLAASNVRHRLFVENSKFLFCEVGVEAQTYETNMTVAGCSISLCDMGFSVERGTSMMRHCDISACRIGVSFTAGDEKNPLFCKSQVLDCSEIGCRMCEGSCGVLCLNDVFECGTCVEFEEDATTELSHCTLAHPSEVATKMISTTGTRRKPRIFDETMTLKQGFSPLHKDKTVKQRKVVYEQKKKDHDEMRLQRAAAAADEEQRITRYIESFLSGIGMSLAKLDTVPREFIARDLEPREPASVQPEPALVEARTAPLRATSLYKDDKSSPVSIPAHTTSDPPPPLQAPLAAKFMTQPEYVSPVAICALVAGRNASAASEDLHRPTSITLQKAPSSGNAGRRLSQASRIVNTHMSFSINSKSDEEKLEDAMFAENPLPPFDILRLGEVLPTVSQRTRLIQDPTLAPPMPKSLELFLLQQPQVEKFGAKSTAQLEQLLQFTRKANPLFAEQILQSFQCMDRRRLYATSVDDLVLFLASMIREYQRGSLRPDLDDHERPSFDESQYDMRPRSLFPSLPGAAQVDDSGRPTKLVDSVRQYITACAEQCGINILEGDVSLRDFVRLLEFRPSDDVGKDKLFYSICRDYFSWMEKLTPAKELSDASVRPFQPPPQLPMRGHRHR